MLRLRIERALNTAVPLDTLSTNGRTARAHVAYLRRGTGRGGTVRTLHATFAFECVEGADQIDVLLHGLRERMPECSIQRIIFGPSRRSSVCFACRVLEFVDWSMIGEVLEAVDIGIPSISFVDVERPCVNFIHAEPTVEIGQRSNAGSDPAYIECRV